MYITNKLQKRQILQKDEMNRRAVCGKGEDMADDRRNVKRGQQAQVSRKAVRAKKKKRKLIIFGVELLLLLLVLAGLWVMNKLSKIDSDDSFADTDVSNTDLSQQTKDILGEYTTIALFGLDNRESGNYSSGNSDVIMIARIDNDTKEVKLVSVYRDTMLNMADFDNKDAYSKANAAYAVGGPEQAVRMLNTNLDLDIREYVSFDFSAVANAVDLLGGVEIEVSDAEAVLMEGYQDEIGEITGKKVKYLNGAGTYNLDGVQAVSYARIRYVGNGDFQRTERQRTVLNKMVEKALASDIGTINDLIDTTFEDIKTSLSKTEIIKLAADAMNYSMGDSAGFPFEQTTGSFKVSYQSSRASCVVPTDLATNVKQLHDFLFGTTNYEVTESVRNMSDAIANRTGKTASDAD